MRIQKPNRIWIKDGNKKSVNYKDMKGYMYHGIIWCNLTSAIKACIMHLQLFAMCYSCSSLFKYSVKRQTFT